MATDGVAGGSLAGVVHGYDGVVLGDDPHVFVAPRAATHRPGTARRAVPESDWCERGGIRVTTPVRTLLDLAGLLDDDRWEQALESALRRGDVNVQELLMVQLIRLVAGVPAPVRQHRVVNRYRVTVLVVIRAC